MRSGKHGSTLVLMYFLHLLVNMPCRYSFAREMGGFAAQSYLTNALDIRHILRIGNFVTICVLILHYVEEVSLF